RRARRAAAPRRAAALAPRVRGGGAARAHRAARHHGLVDFERARGSTVQGMATVEAALSISDAALATGVSVHTLRYYERAGLMLDAGGRPSSSHRRYTEDEVRWVVLLTRLRATGMPIRRVRAYADLVRAGGGNEEERLGALAGPRRG